MTTNSADRCGSCGAEMSPSAAFCRACGAPREEQTLVQPVQSPPPPPPPAPEPPRPPRQGSWRTPILLALMIVLLGAGAAAAIVVGNDADTGSATVVAETETTDAAYEESEESYESDEREEAEEPVAEEEPETYPAVSRTEMEEEIESLLLAYHEDLITGEFRSAWALLSSRKRQQNLDEYGYAEWKEAQASLSDGLTPYGIDVRIDSLEGEGVARVMVTGMGWSDPGSPCDEWSGLTWVRYERGEWTYDPGYSTTAERRRAWEPRSSALLGANC
ncbi:MAG TPA: zinc ribbon domain-containing protein [Solirubrobacterales bacterium]|nr:zinc ribbon domain-containing protein [Solirubrobacterales bacterium]